MEPFEIAARDDETVVYVTHHDTGKTIKFLPTEIVPEKLQEQQSSLVYDDLGKIYIAEMADGTVIDVDLVDLAWAYYNTKALENVKPNNDLGEQNNDLGE